MCDWKVVFGCHWPDIFGLSEQSVFVVPVQPVSVFVCPGHLYLCARDICICCKQAQARPTLIQRPVTLSGFHTFTSRRICTHAKYLSYFFMLCLDLLFFIGFYENVEKLIALIISRPVPFVPV